MEISRRHLAPLERAELREYAPEDVMIRFTDADGNDMPGPFNLAVHQLKTDIAEAQQREAARLQQQMEGMTRNQRRVFKKQLAKAAKRK